MKIRSTNYFFTTIKFRINLSRINLLRINLLKIKLIKNQIIENHIYIYLFIYTMISNQLRINLRRIYHFILLYRAKIKLLKKVMI